MDRDEMNYPALFPHEIERLAILSEELGEAQQAVGKILRHGFYEINPDKPNDGSNYDRLERELGDVQAAVAMVCSASPCRQKNIALFAQAKLERVKKYIHHQLPKDTP